MAELLFLGHFVFKEGIKPNLNKIKAVYEMLVFQYYTQLCKFLGVIVYAKRFIPNYGEHTAPLSIIKSK